MDISSTQEKVRNSSFTTTIMDPIQRFPPEILISIIQSALPSDWTYSACLLDLTNISQKWQTLLLYTPVLWSQLYIDETQPDFLALLSLSINLADKVALKVVLYSRLVHDWAGLGSLLLPAYDRITSVAIMICFIDGYYTLDANTPEECASALSAVFDRFGHPPNLKDIIVDDRGEFTSSLSWPVVINLPPTVRLVGTFQLNAPAISLFKGSKRLFDKAKYEIIHPGVYHMDDLSHLRPLSLECQRLTSDSEVTFRTGADSEVILRTGAHLPRVEYRANPFGECDSFEKLISTTSSSLCSLTLEIDSGFIGDLVDCLQELCSLQLLGLSIVPGTHRDYPKLSWANPTKVIVPTLHTLEMTIWKRSVWDEDVAVRVFEMFPILYPSIQKLLLNAPSWPSDRFSSLESWKTLKDLHLNLEEMLPLPVEYPINLPSVQIMRLSSTPPLGNMTLPSLCRLSLEDTNLTARLNINPHNSYILEVAFTEHEHYEFYLDPTTFSGIRELELVFNSLVPQPTWRLVSFPHLVSISLISCGQFNNPFGDSLCLRLLYYPDSCPSLEEIFSDHCFEWDLLFLMLQECNYKGKGVRKIQTVTLPYVPFHFRKHLELLLAGKHSKGPSFVSQSLEATREVIFDANIPGCYSCLKNKRPNCKKSLKREYSRFWHADDLYPRLEKPPATTAPEIRDYILWHEVLVEEWKKCYVACKFHREDACLRWS